MVLNTNHFCCSTLLKNIMLLKHFLVPWPFLARMMCSMEMGAWQSHFYFQPFDCPMV